MLPLKTSKDSITITQKISVAVMSDISDVDLDVIRLTGTVTAILLSRKF